MDEEVNYVAVTFKINTTSAHGEKNDPETIYDEVKTEKQELYTDLVLPENKKKAPVCSLLHLVAAGLGIVCVILALVVIGLTIHFNAVVSEQRRENGNLTAQNLQLSTAKADLERQKEELSRERDGLSRERDGLSWTIGVILQYENFPVNSLCPQKVCKPCLDGWELFQSNCYHFAHYDYYYDWRTWEGSRNACKQMNADLVVIESQEEQEFINNKTKEYDDENHGYWIGWSSRDARTWADGSNFTVTYWRTQKESYSDSCALTRPRPRPRPDPLANWSKVSCFMRNRWICETRALIKDSDAVSKLV